MARHEPNSNESLFGPDKKAIGKKYDRRTKKSYIVLREKESENHTCSRHSPRLWTQADNASSCLLTSSTWQVLPESDDGDEFDESDTDMTFCRGACDTTDPALGSPSVDNVEIAWIFCFEDAPHASAASNARV